PRCRRNRSPPRRSPFPRCSWGARPRRGGPATRAHYGRACRAIQAEPALVTVGADELAAGLAGREHGAVDIAVRGAGADGIDHTAHLDGGDALIGRPDDVRVVSVRATWVSPGACRPPAP